MNIKQAWNYLLNQYAYFHREEYCPGHPQVFAVESTNVCNLRCIMCPRKSMVRKIGVMDLGLFKEVIDQAAPYTESLFLHNIGEPLLHPEIGEMIEYCQSRGISATISASPFNLNEEKNEEILNSRLDSLILCLDAATKETHEKIRQGSNYEKSISNIESFLKIKSKSKKPFTIMSFIQMKENKAESDEFRKQWQREGIDQVVIKQFKTFGGQRNIMALADREYLLNPIDYPCFEPWKRLVVLWDGRVVPCCSDYDGKVILGDVNKQSLKDIWNGEEMLKLRRQHIRGDFRENELCAACIEKYGAPASNIYPFNKYMITQKLPELIRTTFDRVYKVHR